MASNLQSRRFVSLGKRFVNQICTGSARDSTQSSSLTLRRAVHVSVYDKNPDDQIHSTVVPDEVIEPQSDKYWAPHPKTGVFGPATDGGERAFHTSHVVASEGSVLEQKAFFRSLEDLEKPPHP
ncbi:unnamed protein product [Ilex paraguariensis]|uniref:Uncharacterized protein n=1 Tax=Ilex paraguariensis TaxID=185542 RepID=A0ABC8TXC2_9AQUA